MLAGLTVAWIVSPLSNPASAVSGQAALQHDRRLGTLMIKERLLSVWLLAMTIWAYEELVYGVNWCRRLLGLAFVILLIVRVAHALHA